MNIKHIIFSLAFISFFSACGQTGNKTATPPKDLTTLWEEMMVVHDEVMPKMSDITRLKKQLRGDSANLALITQLTKAEDGMWDWMHNLTPLHKLEEMENAPARDYVLKETAKINTVSKMMKDGIAAAEARLKQKSGQ
ncbi:MAG: hypothetical protein R2795_00015 [Saprospiraceae bacterium]